MIKPNEVLSKLVLFLLYLKHINILENIFLAVNNTLTKNTVLIIINFVFIIVARAANTFCASHFKCKTQLSLAPMTSHGEKKILNNWRNQTFWTVWSLSVFLLRLKLHFKVNLFFGINSPLTSTFYNSIANQGLLMKWEICEIEIKPKKYFWN